jgi:hypothetical protein
MNNSPMDRRELVNLIWCETSSTKGLTHEERDRQAQRIADKLLRSWVITERSEIACYCNDEPVTIGELVDSRNAARIPEN